MHRRCATSISARAGERMLRVASQRLQLSARALHRALKLARTITDLADAEHIAAPNF